ncbi:MAG TPA: hypothetical protein VF754_06375 [Pyrinomonadaceae bacterium]
MRRRLLLIFIACALVAGGQVGVLAALACPHAGGVAAKSEEEKHSCCCCGLGGEEGASCPMMFAESGGVRRQQKTERVAAFSRRTELCANCVGNRLPPPSSNRLSAPADVKRGDACAAPRAVRPVALPVSAFVREVIPAQGSPPGAARLHVLNNVFLI